MFTNRVHYPAWFCRVFDASCTHRSPYFYRIFGTCQVILVPSLSRRMFVCYYARNSAEFRRMLCYFCISPLVYLYRMCAIVLFITFA
jgi:hypothetical protein